MHVMARAGTVGFTRFIITFLASAFRGRVMLGHKAKAFTTHPAVCLEDLVPPDNFYRKVEAKLDLSFVRGLVSKYYSARMGRPSIDPVVFFKLQLIMFFEGFRSERQLMESVNVNLAHRWYIGYDLDEPVPHHSALSRIRDRYGLEVFQRFFEHVVELCIEAELGIADLRVMARRVLGDHPQPWYFSYRVRLGVK